MVGVIDESGQQWERCNGCCKFVRIEELRYEPPSKEYECGRDLCAACAGPDCEPQTPTVVVLP